MITIGRKRSTDGITVLCRISDTDGIVDGSVEVFDTTAENGDDSDLRNAINAMVIDIASDNALNKAQKTEALSQIQTVYVPNKAFRSALIK